MVAPEVAPENVEMWGAGLGFSFFGLRFSRLPCCSLLAMARLHAGLSSNCSTLAPRRGAETPPSVKSVTGEARHQAIRPAEASARPRMSGTQIGARRPREGGFGDNQDEQKSRASRLAFLPSSAPGDSVAASESRQRRPAWFAAHAGEHCCRGFALS